MVLKQLCLKVKAATYRLLTESECSSQIMHLFLLNRARNNTSGTRVSFLAIREGQVYYLVVAR